MESTLALKLGHQGLSNRTYSMIVHSPLAIFGSLSSYFSKLNKKCLVDRGMSLKPLAVSHLNQSSWNINLRVRLLPSNLPMRELVHFLLAPLIFSSVKTIDSVNLTYDRAVSFSVTFESPIHCIFYFIELPLRFSLDFPLASLLGLACAFPPLE